MDEKRRVGEICERRSRWSCLTLWAAVVLLHCSPAGVWAAPHSFPEVPDPDGRYIVYLHGRIVEDQGREAVSPRFGRYRFDEIVAALGRDGATVIAELRPAEADVDEFARRTVEGVRGLIRAGVEPRRITVAGASKGGVIALFVSDRLDEPEVRYAILGSCGEWLWESYSLGLHGRVLSVYEESDPIGRSCQPLFEASPELTERSEVRIETGLDHGFLYQPLDAWVEPTLEWSGASEEAEAGSLSAGRRVEGRSLLSDRLPSIEVRLDPAFRFLGRFSFAIRDVAAGERFVFVDDQDGFVHRLFIAQFEGFLPDNDLTYNYSFAQADRLGGHRFRQNLFAFSVAAARERNPRGEAALTADLLDTHGLEFADEWMTSRYVTVPDAERRHELILFYVENVSSAGHRLGELYLDGAETELWKRIGAGLAGRALKAFEVVEPPGGSR